MTRDRRGGRLPTIVQTFVQKDLSLSVGWRQIAVLSVDALNLHKQDEGQKTKLHL